MQCPLLQKQFSILPTSFSRSRSFWRSTTSLSFPLPGKECSACPLENSPLWKSFPFLHPLLMPWKNIMRSDSKKWSSREMHLGISKWVQRWQLITIHGRKGEPAAGRGGQMMWNMRTADCTKSPPPGLSELSTEHKSCSQDQFCHCPQHLGFGHHRLMQKSPSHFSQGSDPQGQYHNPSRPSAPAQASTQSIALALRCLLGCCTIAAGANTPSDSMSPVHTWFLCANSSWKENRGKK